MTKQGLKVQKTEINTQKMKDFSLQTYSIIIIIF